MVAFPSLRAVNVIASSDIEEAEDKETTVGSLEDQVMALPSEVVAVSGAETVPERSRPSTLLLSVTDSDSKVLMGSLSGEAAPSGLKYPLELRGV